MKKNFSAFVTIALLAAALAGCPNTAEDFSEQTSEQSPAESTLSAEESLAESPVSDFACYENKDGGITVGYHGSDKTVVIPSQIEGKPVTAVGRQGFWYNDTVTKVILPDTVTVIGEEAFNYCTDLETVVLSSGLKEIERNAFKNCLALSSVTLPDTLETIGESAFSNCSALKHIRIPKSLREWYGSFFMSGLETVEFEEGIESIGNGVFAGTQLKEVVLPATVKRLEYAAFNDCLKLESVILNDGLETIGKHAFGWNYSLTEVIIPASVVNMTEFAFEGCRQMAAMKFEGDAPSDYLEDPEELINKIDYTVYYHEGAEGFTSPEWNGYPTEIW